MTWHDRIRAASFRGVTFDVPKRSRVGGRRGPTYEFPNRDLPDAIDTGRKLRVFKITGRIFGSDYDTRRDRLLTALEAPGPGIYIDPWQSSWKVIARSYTCSENDNQGGLAAFTITFEESGDENYPALTENLKGSVSDAADKLMDSAATVFKSQFNVSGFPSYVATDAVNLTKHLADVFSAPGPVGSKISALAEQSLADFRIKITDNVTNGLEIAVKDLFKSRAAGFYDPDRISGSENDPDSAVDLFSSLGSFAEKWPVAGVLTPARKQQDQNRLALSSLVRRFAGAEEAVALTNVSIDSRQDAQAAVLQLGGRLNRLMADAGDDFSDDVFLNVRELKTVTTRDLFNRAGSLPDLRNAKLQASQPSRVLAYKLMGDARLVDDLLARNKNVTHPGFVPPDTKIEYLS